MGGWGAMMIWGITAAIVFPVTVIYSELAAMFPHKSGGLSIYANEGWRRYSTLIGPVATFGYWIGWSVVLSFLGLFTGYRPGRLVPTRAIRNLRVRWRGDRQGLLQHRRRPHRAPAPDRHRPHC